MSSPITDVSDVNDLVKRVDAHQQIAAALARVARGVDRLDRDLIISGYHPDGMDYHGSFEGTASEFADWVVERHTGYIQSCMHLLCNVHIELDGETALCESYVLVLYRLRKDGILHDMMALGRYLDRFELRNGAWKIAERHLAAEKNRIDPVVYVSTEALTELITPGRRDGSDVSYDFFAGRAVP